MTSGESATRRVWLGTLAAALGVTSGCGTRTETGRGDGATPATTQTSAPAETTVPPTATETTRRTQTPDTETDTPARDTGTDTPTPDTETNTPTPALNQTSYEVTRLLGPEDERVETTFEGDLVADGIVGVRLVTSRADWRAVRRDIRDDTGVSYRGLPLVEKTTFSTDALIVVQVEMSNYYRIRLVSGSRETDGEFRLRIRGVDSFPPQIHVGRILLVRVPNGQRLTRAVVEYVGKMRELTVVTDEQEDESETETTTNGTERQRVQPAGGRVHR